MSSIPAKDVVYIDVDDEITTIIDKVRSSQSKILALVLPKRATMLQSVVNMKLLKRSADAGNKHLVLITSEAGLLPLAANVGMYVAKNLQSKPEIPDALKIAELPDDLEESFSLDDAKVVEPNLDKAAAVGELALGSKMPTDVEDSIDLDNSTKPNVINPLSMAKSSKPQGPRNKKLNVPNFDKFRMWFIIGGIALVVLLIPLWYICFKVLPAASILVKTNSTAVNTTVPLVLTTSAASVNTATGVSPAQSQQIKKTYTQQASATGQRNDGQKAAGTVTMSAGACSGTQPADVPAGAGITANNLTFIAQADTSFTPVISKGKCTWQGSQTTAITAQNGGAQYNLAASSFTVVGRSDVSASSTDPMTGGTDQITKLLQQSDIDGAKAKLTAQDATGIKQQLQSQLSAQGAYPIPASFVTGTPNVTTSANAGDAVDSVTVTEDITYTMLGAKQTDLQQLIAKSVSGQIDTTKQSILDYGLSQAIFTPQNSANTNLSMQVTVVAGPDLKTATLRSDVAGKKTGDATQIIKNNPGVTDVTITYSPFWVSSIPNNQNKITITIEKPQVKVNANQ